MTAKPTVPTALALDVLCDFDGTITAQDVTDTLLAAFADPRWEALEADWVAGRIDGRTCMTGQVALIHGTIDALHRVIDGVAIDPAFPAFVAWCRSTGVRLRIVSDGIDRSIARVLARHGLDVPVLANVLEPLGPVGWRLRTPHAREGCAAGAAHCKCAAVDQDRFSVLIGDGRSDVCVAGRVDLALAKDGPDGPSTLLRHCREAGVPHRAFRGFDEVVAILDDLVGRAALPRFVMETGA